MGNVVRRYQAALGGETGVNFADIYGRIMITNKDSRLELLDSELNLLDFTGLQPHEGQFLVPYKLQFNSERNEIMCIFNFCNPFATFLYIFRFISE